MLKQCLSQWLPFFKSVPNSGVTFIVLFTNILKTEDFSIKFIKPRVSPIGYLLLSGCPFAVLRAITLVVVYSFYGVTVWACTHITKKRFKRGIPLTANIYTSSAVISVLPILVIIASVLHSLPRVILSGFRHIVSSVAFSREAAARLYASLLKVIPSYGSNRAARTLANPIGPCFGVVSVANGKAAKYLATTINKIIIGHKIAQG